MPRVGGSGRITGHTERRCDALIEAIVLDPDLVGIGQPPADPPAKVGPTRFWGRKDLNPAAAQRRREFEKFDQEVIALLQRELGSQVTVTISVEVTTDDGFSESVVRNVKANADTLRFDNHGFA